jgi:outer membrane protein TolC
LKIIISLLLVFTVVISSEIDFDDLLQKTIKSSLALKIAKLDTSINKAKVSEVYAKYYPTLSVTANSEYDDTDIGSGGVTLITLYLVQRTIIKTL